jgi:hypothetical protein
MDISYHPQISTFKDLRSFPPLPFLCEAAGSEVQMWLEELGLGRYFGLLQAMPSMPSSVTDHGWESFYPAW